MENCGSDQMVPGTHDNTFPSSSCVAMADGKSQMWHCDVVDGKLSAAQTVYTDIVCTDVEHVHGVAVHQTFHLEDAKYGKAHCFTVPGPWRTRTARVRRSRPWSTGARCLPPLRDLNP